MAYSNMCSKLAFLVLFCLTSIFTTSLAAVTPASSTYVRGAGPQNVTLSLNVPQNSTDTLFFHFNGPAKQTWLAFGFGQQMANSLMFVVYTSEDGKNVTVSPRLGTGHFMPQHTSDVTVSLFAGSGIANGVYTVNGMCNGCVSWQNGFLETTSTSAPMLWAIGPAGKLASDDLDATIVQHQIEGTFTLDLAKANGIGGVPLTGSTSSGSTETSGDDGTSTMVKIHALFLVVAFLIVFPGGYLFLRVFEKVMLHAATQSVAMLLVFIGIALGIAASKKDNLHPNIDAPHQILGIIVLVLVLATWALGFAAHQIYKRTGSPAKFMIGHRVLGPLTIALGLVNACVGFNFAGNNRPIIGLVIITIAMVLFVTGAVLLSRRRKQKKQAMNTPAAINFREGQRQEGMQHAAPQQAAGHGPAIPMQTYQPKAPQVNEGYVQ